MRVALCTNETGCYLLAFVAGIENIGALFDARAPSAPSLVMPLENIDQKASAIC